jgi:hypothetical protein
MDVFTAAVEQILEQMTSAALGVNADKPYDTNTADNAMLPKVLDVRQYKGIKKKKGKPVSKISIQRRSLNPA